MTRPPFGEGRGSANSMEMAAVKPKIAMYLPNLGGGGAERVAVYLANGLAERGYPTTFVLGEATGPYLADTSPDVRVVELKRRHTTTSILPLARYLRREMPAVLFSHLDYVNIGALAARALARVNTRVVPIVHMTYSQAQAHQRVRRARFVGTAMRWLYPRAARVVVVSQGAADDLVRSIGVPNRLIRVIYNPVITPRMKQLSQQPPSHPWLAPGSPPLILGIGRLTRQKDFATLLRAVAILRKRRDCRLLILGEGEERPALERLVQELQLTEIVALPGFVENPYGYLGRCALFALSSAWEALPTVLIEALAAGASVVSTDCPSGPAEILHKGQFGRLVPVADSEALAQAMQAALAEGHSAAPTEALQPYMVDYAVNEYCRLIDEVLND
jgi:glycosyltransferase involved in cell wall biosynthesis